jgi:hypothetical protein
MGEIAVIAKFLRIHAGELRAGRDGELWAGSGGINCTGIAADSC